MRSTYQFLKLVLFHRQQCDCLPISIKRRTKRESHVSRQWLLHAMSISDVGPKLQQNPVQWTTNKYKQGLCRIMTPKITQGLPISYLFQHYTYSIISMLYLIADIFILKFKSYFYMLHCYSVFRVLKFGMSWHHSHN